jgi:hypothetical protein
MRRAITNYISFDALAQWPDAFSESPYDLITAFGILGLSKTPEAYSRCFQYIESHLNVNGRVIRADWIRSTSLIDREGHDNSYLCPDLLVESSRRAGLNVLTCEKVDILEDPLFDRVVVWSLSK